MGILKTCGILILLLPAAGTVLVGALGRPVLRGRSHWPVILGVAGAVICSFVVLGQFGGVSGDEAHGDTQAVVSVYQWIATGAPETREAPAAWFNISFLFDPLTCVMLVTVTGVSLLVIIYSREYMRQHGHPERGYERFFAFLGLFVFSMCALVLSGNFLLLYLGWEAVGLCSYLLIGFYYGKPEAAAAAKKAFLVNRIGDFGFGLGILLIYLTFNTLDYQAVFGMVADRATASGAALTDGRITAIALLLFCGAVGKSAQIPLYVWLPDAMEGPSPVSALIHAATMVTAGVYMVARCGVIFTQSSLAMAVVASIGAVTALFAATIALTQHDMKRVLAYSTISQLGYMFLGLGVFAATSAIFHLFTHAFFKALLFLAAGSVMHAMGGVIDMRRFSGLRRIMPWTYRTFVIGGLALAGFPLLSGFWSKDEIIHAAMTRSPLLGAIGLLTAVMTAFYTFRMVFRAFHGAQRVPPGVHAHEAGKWILVPLCLLAVGAIGAGYVNVHIRGGGFLGFLEPGAAFESFLHPAVAPFASASHHASSEHGGGHMLMYLSGLLAVAGIGVAWWVYVRRPDLAGGLARMSPQAYDLSYNKYYVDEMYDAGVVKPLRGSGKLAFGIDEYVIDGLIWLVTAVPRLLAFGLKGLQSGSLQGYAVTMAAGFAIILLLVLWM
ncbi:MAG: NADH-quinone oxidoreductase subunit L [Phycisphaerales bacterium]|nr:MAG: NADH-quinone oxidoreductase subunit L [Phycisphaerales bacterium]